MKKLLIDTSTQALILILSEELHVIDYLIDEVIKDHSSKLMPSIDLLLKRNKIDIQEIEEIIVANGPGSYTGVRIGVTVGKTLSYALNATLLKISTLKLMSANYMHQAKYIVPLIDARRGNVFAALYEVEQNKLQPILEDKLYSYLDLIKLIKSHVKEDVLFVGIDALKLSVCDEQFHYAQTFIEDFNPNLIMSLDFEQVPDLHAFVPNYKRLAEAEINLK